MFHRRYAVLLLLLLLLVGVLVWVATLQSQLSRSASRTSFGVCPPDPTQCINGNTWICTNYKLLFVCNNGSWEFWTGLEGSSGATGATGATGPSISTSSASSTITSTSSTSTITSTSSTTTVPTTLPSNFSIICPPAYIGELEATIADVYSNYTVTGYGCGNTTVNTTFAPQTPTYSKRQLAAPRTPSTITVNVTVHGTSSVMIVVQPTLFPANDTETESFAVGQPTKRDINNANTAWVATDPVTGVSATYTTLPPDGTELYVSSAGNGAFKLGIDNFGRMEALIWNASTFGAPVQTLLWTTLFSSACVSLGEIQPVKVVYDFEASKFVVAVLAGNLHNSFCVAVSQTSDPTGSWWSYVFTDGSGLAFYNYSHGFDFAVWGDHYTACWNLLTSRRCGIFERSQMIVGGTPRTVDVFAPFNPLFSNAPIEPLPQRESTRGAFMTIAAFGAFAAIDEATSTLTIAACVSINYTLQQATFSPYVMTVTGGWFSGATLPCTYCIPTCYGANVSAFSNYIRVAYFNYNSYEAIGFAFANNVGTAANVKWAVVNVSDVLLSLPVTPSTYSTVAATNIFATSVLLTCRETFIMTSSDGCGSMITTYRLRTDPIGTVRATPYQIGGFTPGFGNSSMAMTNIQTGEPIPRSFFIQSSNYNGYSVFSARLMNSTLTNLYTATDVCGASVECSQPISLSTIAPCNNSYIPW